MRLGRKLSEGFTVDHEAEAVTPTPVAEAERAVPVTAESELFAATEARPVASGPPPVG